MADPTGRGDQGGAAAPASSERFSIGRYLAAQRQLRGISLDDLSARTKIPRRNLERLESGAFDAQSDGFVRGFVRTVADALGLDSQEAVMRMVGEPAPGDDALLWRRRVRIGVVAAVIGGALLIGMGLALRYATRWVVEPAGGPPDHIYRRDVVRALAEGEHERGAAKPPAEPAPSADAMER